MSNGDNASKAAQAQHAMLGIKEDKSNYKRTTHPDAQWFGSAGLGLFLHWGISTVHGEIDLSWGMIANLTWGNRKPVMPAEYWKLAERFNPENYDPERWIAAAKAGFRYAVLTTRHHDGFALWPSEHGNFSTRNYMGGEDYQTLDHILGRLKQVRKWGGNYLINAAPRADGTMPEAFYERMAELAALGGFSKLDKEWRSL